ncbi:MAG: cupredoxin domain-containing protein, partial [Ilumatobacteraceae bacterium]
PSPQAALALILEIVGIVLVAATFVPAIGPGGRLAVAPAAVAAGLAVVVAIGGAVLWAREDEGTASSPPPATSPTTVPAATSTTAPTTSPTTTSPTTTTSVPDGPATTGSDSSTTEAPTTAATTAPATTAPPTAAPAAANVVSIVDFAFEAPMLEVPVGTTVEWVNNDSFAHSVVAEDGSFQSEDLAPGERYTFTFTTSGSFAYLCGIHPSMRATIVVTG